MKFTFEDATVNIEELPTGKNKISVMPLRKNYYVSCSEWETSYPLDLIRQIMTIRSPSFLCDAIKREEEQSYMSEIIERGTLSYIEKEALAGKRLLDFGCGDGATSLWLARLFPNTEIVGMDMDESVLRIAGLKTEHYGLTRITYILSPSSTALPKGVGTFDYIFLIGVYEHLLPKERETLFPEIWSTLHPGGILFIFDTPNRYFPVEIHTTGLPLVNYLPDRSAHYLARRCSRRNVKDDSWETLLRKGVRGGTVKEIMRSINNACGTGTLLNPHRLGVRNRIDLWYTLSGGKRLRAVKAISSSILKLVMAATGCELTPYLTLAIRKIDGK